MATPIIANDHTARMDLMCESAHQIEGLSDMALAAIMKLNTSGTDGIKAAIIRIRDLSGLMFRVLDDDDHDLPDMRREVHGRAEEVQHAQG